MRATVGRPYDVERTAIESVGAVCDRPLRADNIRPYEMGREMSR